MADEPTKETQASLKQEGCRRRRFLQTAGVSATSRNARSFGHRLWSVRHSRGPGMVPNARFA